MTPERAINYLTLNKPSSGYPGLCEAIDMAIAALRDRPAPPDALVAKLNVRHDEALHTAIGWMSQEENLVTTREALIELLMMLKPVIFAAPAPVAAPAPETVTLPPHVPAIVLRRALNAPRRFEVGDVVTGVSTGMTDDGRWEQSITKVARNGQPLDVYGLSAAPAPETPAPDAMPEDAPCPLCGGVIDGGACLTCRISDVALTSRPWGTGCHHCDEQPPDQWCWWCGRRGTGRRQEAQP